MDDCRQCIQRLAVDQNVQLHKVGFAIAGELVIQRGVTAGDGLQFIEKIEDDFRKREFIMNVGT